MTTINRTVADDVLVERDIVTHDAARKGLAVLRIAYGVTFLWAFFDKLLALGFHTGYDQDGNLDRFGPAAWVNGGSPTEGFLAFGVPEDNPFNTPGAGKYGAIWAYGLRNPYTFDVQAGTGRILVNDVGAALWEEVNELERGANYGWPLSEGPTTDPAFAAPLHAYAHSGTAVDDSAITGAAGPLQDVP